MIDFTQSLPSVWRDEDGSIRPATIYDQANLALIRRGMARRLQARFGPLDKRGLDTYLSLCIDGLVRLDEAMKTAQSLSELGLED